MASLAERTADYFETLARLTRDASVSDGAGRPMTIAAGIEEFLKCGRTAHGAGNKLIFVGNGASASMASHYALDFSKNAGIRALALNDGAMLTALTNDIGGEAIFAEQVGFYAQAGDVLVAISSSGSSPNILAAVEKARDRECAVVTFSGICRDEGNRLAALELEHYPGMTEKMLTEIEAEANRRWPLQNSLIVHRYGRLEPGDRIVLVVTASAHREAALEACHFLIDWLKTKAPFWKLEETGAGEGKWVEARTSDDAAADRWKKNDNEKAAE